MFTHYLNLMYQHSPLQDVYGGFLNIKLLVGLSVLGWIDESNDQHEEGIIMPGPTAAASEMLSLRVLNSEKREVLWGVQKPVCWPVELYGKGLCFIDDDRSILPSQ